MKLARILLGITMLLAFSIDAAAQTQSKDKVMDWVDQWQIATKQLLGVAETMPAGKYDYKPVKEVDNFGDQIKHATMAMKVHLANAEGKTVKTAETFVAMQKLKTKEEIIAEFRKTAEEGSAVFGRVAGKTDGDVVQCESGVEIADKRVKKLPSYQTFVARLNRLEPTFQSLGAELQARLRVANIPEIDQVIDSLPVMLARGGHAYTATVARETADVVLREQEAILSGWPSARHRATA